MKLIFQINLDGIEMVYTFVEINHMTNLEAYKIRKKLIKDKLSTIKFPKESETRYCWIVGAALDVSGVTVKNYINGNVKDGYLAESIFAEFKRLKLVK